ncbi:MAG: hypothetical protein F6J93_01560 [Oscillatoria sp. SIO1A7]|nr:hypothetical protein [Oscillatoria sp. SIO1A7]
MVWGIGHWASGIGHRARPGDRETRGLGDKGNHNSEKRISFLNFSLFTFHSSQCPISHAQFPMPDARCPMPNSHS